MAEVAPFTTPPHNEHSTNTKGRTEGLPGHEPSLAQGEIAIAWTRGWAMVRYYRCSRPGDARPSLLW